MRIFTVSLLTMGRIRLETEFHSVSRGPIIRYTVMHGLGAQDKDKDKERVDGEHQTDLKGRKDKPILNLAD